MLMVMLGFCPLPIPLDIEEEQVRIAENHFRAMSDFLGTKQQSSTSSPNFNGLIFAFSRRFLIFLFYFCVAITIPPRAISDFSLHLEDPKRMSLLLLLLLTLHFKDLSSQAKLNSHPWQWGLWTPNHWTTRKLHQKTDFDLHTPKQRKGPSHH